MNTQENRIKVFVNDSRENYSVLTYSENGLYIMNSLYTM